MSSSPQTDRDRRLRLWPRSLTGGLIASSIALVALVSVVVGAVTTVALRQFLLHRLDDQLQAVIRGVDAGFGPAGPGAVCRAGAPLGTGPADLAGVLGDGCRQVQVSTVDAAQHTYTTRSVGAPDLSELADVTPGSPTTVHIDGAGDYRVLILDDGGTLVVAGLSTGDVNGTVSRLAGWEVLVALLGVLAAAAAATYAVRRQLRPLNAVAATAREVARRPLDTGAVEPLAQVPTVADPDTEVGQVADALNTMLRHVERAFAARHESEQQARRFLADASHELRTPLTTIQGYAELSRRAGASDEESLRHAMSKVEVESDRMADLVDDLLLLARLDAGRPLDDADVDVSRLAVEAVNDARVIDAGRTWRLSIPDDAVVIRGDSKRLHQAVSNLLSNARRHTPPGTTVAVSVSSRPDGGADVTVHDDGPGLPDSLRGHEFDRFSRGDSSRTRASGGAGLGLSIVRAVVEAHGGTVRVESEPGDTLFTVCLPFHHDYPVHHDAGRGVSPVV
jgi:two-component system OmpR family sensor kinase